MPPRGTRRASPTESHSHRCRCRQPLWYFRLGVTSLRANMVKELLRCGVHRRRTLLGQSIGNAVWDVLGRPRAKVRKEGVVEREVVKGGSFEDP